MNYVDQPFSEKMMTIVIPTHNHEKYIEQTIQSVVKQSIFSNCVVIVSDDGSTDNTCSIAADLIKDFDNIHLRKNQTQLGIIPHYRELADSVETEFLAILEGDDFWLSTEKLLSSYKFLRSFPNQDCVFTGFQLVDEAGAPFELRPDLYSPGRSGLLFFEELLLTNHIASFSNCVYRTDAFKSVIMSPNALRGFDWYINLVLAARAPIGFLAGEFGAYRVHEGGTWSRMDARKKALGITATLESVRSIVSSHRQSLVDAAILRLNCKELQR
jgi:glycosyltransferase involved in cell wall biosynthesis